MRRFSAIFVLLSSLLFANPALHTFTFHEAGNGTFQLKMDVLLYQISENEIAGTTYSVINFDASVFTKKSGYAQLPVLSKLVQLPARRDMNFEIIGSSFEEIDLSYPLLPSRGVIYRNQNPADIPYQIDPASITDEWYPGTLSNNDNPVIIRDRRGNRINFYPFQYNPVQQKLRIYKQITIQQSETDGQAINPLNHAPGVNIMELRGLYESLFINPDAEEALPVAELGDLLIITTARDEAAIQPYIDWKLEKGFNVTKQVVATGTLVKDLIQQEYDANPNLLYVQLVGDWADIKSELGTSSNLPMDPDMGCVSGTDNHPDIAIGRISAISAEQVTLQVNKILNYEQNPSSQNNWLSTATGIASNEGSGDDNEYDKEHLNVIWNDKLDPFTYDQHNAIYDPGATDAQVANAVNNGTSVINYTGHGYSTGWSTSGFNNDDVQNLSNGQMLPFIISVACNNGEFNLINDCFAEAWLKKEGGGAVMMLAATISQPWDPPMRGQDYFMDMLIGGYDYDAYPGQNGINTDDQRTFSGTMVVNGFNLMLSESSSSSDLETVQTWTIFGDPSMQLRTADPAPLTLSNEAVRAAQPFNTIVTSSGVPVSNAMVTLSQNGSYFSASTDANGEVTIEQTTEPGAAKLVVTAFNTETIYLDVTVSSIDGPWIVTDSYSVNDLNVGNGNNQAEFGESFNLDVAAKNSGNETAQNVSAILSSNDSYLVISDNEHNYGSILADQIIAGTEAFGLSFSDNVPDQHSATCQILFTDQLDSSWTSNLSILAHAPDLTAGEIEIDDSAQGNDDQDLDIGESADLHIPTINNGHATAGSVQASLATNSSFLTINTVPYDLGSIQAEDTVAAIFNVTAASDVTPGTEVELYYAATSTAYTCLDTFLVRIGNLPSVLMSNSTEYVDEVLFYDAGGPDGDYDTSQRLTMTFYPTNRSVIKADFQSFLLSDFDALSIHDGEDTDAPEVSGSPFTTTNSPGEVVATNGAGALTFYFNSNVVYTESGWRAYVYSTVIADVERQPEAAIKTFELEANYPNPFNPQTTIRYQIPKANFVELTVYNTLGQQVRKLVEARQEAGNYAYTFDASGLASGIYYYKLSAGTFSQIRKMILIK